MHQWLRQMGVSHINSPQMGNLEVAQGLHGAMVDTIIFLLYAPPCLIPCFTPHVYNMAAAAPGLTSMFQPSKTVKVKLTAFVFGQLCLLWMGKNVCPQDTCLHFIG